MKKVVSSTRSGISLTQPCGEGTGRGGGISVRVHQCTPEQEIVTVKMSNQLHCQHLHCLHWPKPIQKCMLFPVLLLEYNSYCCIFCICESPRKQYLHSHASKIRRNKKNVKLKWAKCCIPILHQNAFCLRLYGCRKCRWNLETSFICLVKSPSDWLQLGPHAYRVFCTCIMRLITGDRQLFLHQVPPQLVREIMCSTPMWSIHLALNLLFICIKQELLLSGISLLSFLCMFSTVGWQAACTNIKYINV